MLFAAEAHGYAERRSQFEPRHQADAAALVIGALSKCGVRYSLRSFRLQEHANDRPVVSWGVSPKLKAGVRYRRINHLALV